MLLHWWIRDLRISEYIWNRSLNRAQAHEYSTHHEKKSTQHWITLVHLKWHGAIESERVCARERSSHHQIWTNKLYNVIFGRRSLSLHSPSFPSIRCSIRPPNFFGCHVKINSSNMPKRSVSGTFFLFSKIHLTLLKTHKCQCTFFDEFHRLIPWSGMCTTHVQFSWKTNHGITPTLPCHPNNGIECAYGFCARKTFFGHILHPDRTGDGCDCVRMQNETVPLKISSKISIWWWMQQVNVFNSDFNCCV